jgi:RNA polymerase sigma-70 factor (ECF subfamily)
MSTLDDGAAALMGRYCDGDETAFTALYRRMSPRLTQLFRRRVGDRARADDLVQQTFLKLHRARATYVRGADPLPWIYTIARRVLVDDQRARARQPLGEAAEIAVEPRVRDRPLCDAIVAALARLPACQSTALRLTHVDGLSMADAAARLGTSVGAVKLRAHRGRRTLRVLLASYAS